MHRLRRGWQVCGALMGARFGAHIGSRIVCVAGLLSLEVVSVRAVGSARKVRVLRTSNLRLLPGSGRRMVVRPAKRHARRSDGLGGNCQHQ